MLFFITIFSSNFAFHQRKGGIHAIYRYIMDTFGYSLTGSPGKII